MRRLFVPLTLIALALVAARSSAALTADEGGGLTYAIIGDTPYGPAELAAFPRLVSAVNNDPDVRLTLHLGDIKDGASVCSDAYFDQMRANFDSFQDPLVVTPGDNPSHVPARGRRENSGSGRRRAFARDATRGSTAADAWCSSHDGHSDVGVLGGTRCAAPGLVGGRGHRIRPPHRGR